MNILFDKSNISFFIGKYLIAKLCQKDCCTSLKGIERTCNLGEQFPHTIRVILLAFFLTSS